MKQYIGIIIGITLAIGFSVFAFTEPTQAPPGGNVTAPLNVSGTAQTKAGDLTVNNFFAKNFSVAPGVSEYNITNVNIVSGSNDLFIKGNSSETAPVYITGSDVKIYTAGAERLTITNSGNVGIGTVSPDQKLHIVGTGYATGDFRAPIFYDTNNTGYYVDPASTSNLNAFVSDASTVGRIRFRGVGGDSGVANEHYGIYQEQGPWTHPYPDLVLNYHTGIKYVGYFGYGGHRFYTGYSPDAAPTTLAFSIGEGDHNVRVTNDLFVGSLGGWASSVLCRSNGTNCPAGVSSLPWLSITSRPAGLDNGDDVGITNAQEIDPTVIASVKDGVSWGEVSSKPTLCESNGTNCPAGAQGGAFGGGYLENVGSLTTCQTVNPATGGCSCPSGFSAIHISQGPWNFGEHMGYVCYK